VSQFADYHKAGWALCAIERGHKAPTYPQWNVKPIPADALDGIDGAGLLHALSKTCALDLDNLTAARIWLTERGIDIDVLLAADDAVQITSGRPNRAKLLYRMSRPLRTLKPKGSGLELRCATAEGASVQDVLPPSFHPDTKKPYEWAGGILGDWRKLPTIPPALLSLWRGLTDDESEPVKTVESDKPQPVDLNKLRKAAFKHDPDAEYDEWLRVGMQLHDATGGAQEGFDIWAEWSQGIKRKAYPGDALLKTHWLSFSSTGGKHVASGAALVSELPADAEDFPIEAEQPDEPVQTTRKAITAKLEERLVFVHSVERYFDTERHKLIGSDNTIEHMFTSWMPLRKGGRISPVRALKESPTKRFVDALGFHPGEGAIFKNRFGDSLANNYRSQLPEALEPTAGELERIAWLFDRIDDVPFREWLVQFLGHIVQRPGIKIKSAPLIWSDTQGNGKTTLLKMIPTLLCGARYSREVTCALLNSDFNDYLLNAWHINLTEFRAGARGERAAIAQKLRAWITDDEISVHPKGSTAYNMPNHFFTTATSNEDDAASVDNNDRRWAIHEMHAPQFTESEQQWIYGEFLLTPRAAGVLRHYFLHVSLDGFSASAKAPETEARQAMIRSSLSADTELLEIAFEQHSAPLDRDIVIVGDVADWVRKNSVGKPSADRIGKILAKAPFGGEPKQFRVGEARYRGIIIRDHTRWRGATGQQIISNINGEDADLTL
jgi:hypothetical protein